MTSGTPNYSSGFSQWVDPNDPTSRPASPAAPKMQSNPLTLDLEKYIDRNEQGDAEFFAQLYKGQIVFDHSTKTWYIWRGQYWDEDTRREIIGHVSNRMASLYISMAAQILSQQGATVYYNKLITRGRLLQALTRVKHVLELASSEPDISLAGTEWDSNPDLLPVNNGVVDLRTGKLRNCQPSEYIRHHSPVDWKSVDEPCPIWERTLDGIFDGDKELIGLVQRLDGYAATGHVTENKLPIFVGEEAQNGKTTMFETIHKILGGDLCVSLPMKALMKSAFDTDGNKPDPYLVTLKGKRLAYSSESAKGMKLDTAIIKKLTGGDTLNPRGMYEKVGKGFTPTHKLMLFTNDKPIVPPDDAGAWERIMLIELNITFKDNPTKPNERQKDKDLREKLETEHPGILAWIVRGCLEWRKQGLNPPAKVINATAAYRDDEDILSDFISDACVLGTGPGYEVKVTDFFGRYRNWCNKYGIANLDMREFKKQMKRKFGEPKKKNSGYFYQGVR